MIRRTRAALGIATLVCVLTIATGTTGCALLDPSPGPTPRPTNTRRPQPQIIPTWTPIPSPTPVPTATPLPAPVQVSDCRLGSAFVADVTIPDRTVLQAGETFVKTWALRNTGSCPWGEGYFLAFVGKQQMGAPDRVPVPETAPGATAEISVTFTAPTTPGSYRSDWQMYVESEPPRHFGTVVYTLVIVE